MEALGKRVFITLDEPIIEEVKVGGVQKDFTPKIIKPTTGIINYIGDQVDITRFKKGDRVFIGEFYAEKTVDIPGVGNYTIVNEDSIIAKL